MKSVQWIIRKCGKGDRIVKYEFQVCDSLRLGLLFLDLHFVVEVPPGQHIPRGLHRSNDLAKVRMYPDHLELIKMKIVWKKKLSFFVHTSMPMASGCEVFLFANAPSQTMSVPKDVPIFGNMFINRPLWSPFHGICRHFVSTVAVGIGRSQDIQSLANDIRYSLFISWNVD